MKQQRLFGAANSIAPNIAEGKGRRTDKDFCRFLYQARGSLLETVCSLHLAVELGFCNRPQFNPFTIKPAP
ncbi:four helix bundle protein [Meiothermus sp.]|uniref:four helix bundle protein n=1 Tax=Meiothermus sp. TaxID=1955249 RepID=UPI0035B5019A